MLTLKNISAGYGGAPVIKNINMQIDSNISIVGPNGCGKTTLLKVIANILPSNGDIRLNNKSFNAMKHKEISAQIALLSQQPAIYFSYSVFDTVMLGRYLHIKDRLFGTPAKNDNEAVINSLKAVDMLSEKDTEITKLSGGQLQRVFIARVLAQEPRIILLDEPTNHLDIKCQIEIINYLKTWAKGEKRIIIGVLHDINLALELCNHLIVMKNGEIRADDSAGKIVSSGIFNEVYEMDVAEHMRKSLKRWECL